MLPRRLPDHWDAAEPESTWPERHYCFKCGDVEVDEPLKVCADCAPAMLAAQGEGPIQKCAVCGGLTFIKDGVEACNNCGRIWGTA